MRSFPATERVSVRFLRWHLLVPGAPWSHHSSAAWACLLPAWAAQPPRPEPRLLAWSWPARERRLRHSAFSSPSHSRLAIPPADCASTFLPGVFPALITDRIPYAHDRLDPGAHCFPAPFRRVSTTRWVPLSPT